MKIAEPDNPVRYSWLADQGYRLSPGPFVSDGYAARMLLKNFPRTETLGEVTSGRVFRPGIFQRRWTTDPEYGVPFLSSADIFQSDLSSLAMITKKSFEKIPKLELKPGWTLITCSGMTAGRVTYSRLDMDGYACSQDVIRAAPDTDKIPAGYLYTFLASPPGLAMIKGTAYGTSVKHIEPGHLVDLPIPRLDEGIERQIDALVQTAMACRARFQSGIVAATQDMFSGVGLEGLVDYRWSNESHSFGFSSRGVDATSLRALNYDARAKRIIEAIKEVPHRTLGEICAGGELARGNRFSRVPSDAANGFRLVGQEQMFWLRPEGRWIALKSPDVQRLRASSETIMVASQGLLTEGALIGRAAFVFGRWSNYVFSEHLLRVRSGSADFSNAYLFAFLRSEVAFRVLRSLCVGTGPQDINPVLRRQIPVPDGSQEDQARIAETVRRAYRQREEADALEDQAQALLAKAMREAA